MSRRYRAHKGVARPPAAAREMEKKKPEAALTGKRTRRWAHPACQRERRRRITRVSHAISRQLHPRIGTAGPLSVLFVCQGAICK